jgi:hypothetical protein
VFKRSSREYIAAAICLHPPYRPPFHLQNASITLRPVWPNFLSGYYQTLCWNFTKLDFFYQTRANSAFWNFWLRAVIVVMYLIHPFWPFSWLQHHETVK